MRIVGTGVRVSLADAAAGEPCIEGHLFAETESGGSVTVHDGTSYFDYDVLAGDDDPTSALLRFAYESREIGLRDLLGDLRIAGERVGRWEFYAAPFRVEMDVGLRRRLGHRLPDR